MLPMLLTQMITYSSLALYNLATDICSQITNMMEGKIVPAKLIDELLDKAMKESGNGMFLINGFPCALDNLKCFESDWHCHAIHRVL